MKVIKKIANKHNVSEQEVKAEMRAAIRAAMENQTPESKEMWEKLFPDNNEPTPDEFIKAICNYLKQGS